MKIAVPTSNQLLCMHFGHCEVFSFFEIDTNSNTISNKEELTPPAHEPGVLPQWIKDQNATVVLAGGMGMKAQQLFSQAGVEVVVGVTESNPEQAVLKYLQGSLKTGANACDH